MGKGMILPIVHTAALVVCVDQGIRLMAEYPIGIWIWPVVLGNVVLHRAIRIIAMHHKAIEKGD